MERLELALRDRSSIRDLFAAFFLSMLGLVAFGVSMRLLHDSASLPKFFWPVAALFLGCLGGAIRLGIRGRGKVHVERAQFSRYKALRDQLGQQ